MAGVMTGEVALCWVATDTEPATRLGLVVLGVPRDQGDSVWKFAVGKQGDLDAVDRRFVVLGL